MMCMMLNVMAWMFRCVCIDMCNDVYVLYYVRCSDVHDVECDGMDI